MKSLTMCGMSLLAFALAIVPVARADEACPADSEEINRTVRGDKTVIRCRCRGERLYFGGSCQAPETAPLTTRALGVITGTVFSAGAVLQAYARKQNWPATAIQSWDFSTLEAKFGRYGRARAFLEIVRKFVKPDQVFVTLDTSLAKLQEYRKRELAKYFQKYPGDDETLRAIDEALSLPDASRECDIACLRKDKWLLYKRVSFEARLDRESGDYESAITKYRDALRIANLGELGPNIVRSTYEDIVWSRQLRASWVESNNPGTWKNFNRIRRNDMAAARAEMLALHLSQAGQGKAAIAYLEEARTYYQKTAPERVPYVAEEIARLRANDKANVLGEITDDRPLTIYTNASSQSNIMFDAIEYGKGDWFKSIKYLEAALAVDPENKKIFGALNYVKGMSSAKETQ